MGDVPQPVDAEVYQPHAGLQLPPEHGGGCFGAEDLATLRGRRDPGGVVQDQPAVFAPFELHVAGVEGHPDPRRVRFRGQPGEQGTMFLRDPAGNNLEFKALASLERLFAR